MLGDTIAAVAAGEGSVVIVRMTWPQAKAIGRSLFVAPGLQV